jgi:hypothetical protein
MSKFIKFTEWLEKRVPTVEMTSSGSATGGMTSTADIAGFARPLQLHDDDKKKTHLVRRMKKEK